VTLVKDLVESPNGFQSCSQWASHEVLRETPADRWDSGADSQPYDLEVIMIAIANEWGGNERVKQHRARQGPRPELLQSGNGRWDDVIASSTLMPS
jgi:hypothetical protein